MRLLGELSSLDETKKFTAYLLTEGIASKVEQENQVWEIWIKDEDEFARSQKEFSDFLEDPNTPKYKGVIEKATAITKEEEKKRRQIQKNIVRVSEGRSAKQKTPLTIMLIVISAVVALLTNFGSPNMYQGSVYRALAFNCVEAPRGRQIVESSVNPVDDLDVRLASIQRGQIWRMITPIFLHGDTLHILFNMIMLFQLGKIAESRFGTFWFAVIVIATAAIPNFLQGAVPAAIGGTPSVYDAAAGILRSNFLGMSGVVFGLFGFVWMKSIYDPNFNLRLSPGVIIFLLGYMFFCMTPLAPKVGLHVANWAHGAGLVVGMLAGYLPSLLKR